MKKALLLAVLLVGGFGLNNQPLYASNVKVAENGIQQSSTIVDLGILCTVSVQPHQEYIEFTTPAIQGYEVIGVSPSFWEYEVNASGQVHIKGSCMFFSGTQPGDYMDTYLMVDYGTPGMVGQYRIRLVCE